jgi:ParB family chromosome partitioning protein
MSAKEVSPRLGRGLAALLGDAPAPAQPAAEPPRSAGVSSVPIEHLEPGPFQPRRNMEPQALADLADSIRAQGVLQPLLARPTPGQTDRFQIIAGERRWRAAQQAGLHTIPVLIRTLTDVEAAAAALVENLQRQDLNAIEEAEGYQRLAEDFQKTQEAIAVAVGKSRSHIANTMRLLNLPPTVREEVRKGALSAGHARTLVGRPDAEKLALAIISRGLNVRQAEALTAIKSVPSASRQATPKDPETAALEQDLSERLGLKVDIAFDGRGGTVRIQYRSLDQLDGLVALLSRS